ncbi:DUF837 domain-containing protein [Methylobacterium sp. Leaf399]|uniref:DUF837 domain-containing protein n=1 Tax=Methylobacterium sp. Leaf399 TaxID=1736364 RepID=UPI001FCD2237|nr:DUF837 domain-containing protein [Methylobacterium sp. Leaf399]
MKAYRSFLFDRWVEAKRHAQVSEDPADHRAAVDAYTAFMRAHLSSEERTRLDLEDEIACLTVENGRLQARLHTPEEHHG